MGVAMTLVLGAGATAAFASQGSDDVVGHLRHSGTDDMVGQVHSGVVGTSATAAPMTWSVRCTAAWSGTSATAAPMTCSVPPSTAPTTQAGASEPRMLSQRPGHYLWKARGCVPRGKGEQTPC
jgi:hypothetical protein